MEKQGVGIGDFLAAGVIDEDAFPWEGFQIFESFVEAESRLSAGCEALFPSLERDRGVFFGSIEGFIRARDQCYSDVGESPEDDGELVKEMATYAAHA